jgi:hypothetical protein
MKKLVILHDISSYYDFQVLEHLQSMLNDVDVIPVEISYPYKYVMRNLHKFCYQVKPDAIIGLSAGAMFAQQMHGYRKILINPILHVSWECATIESVQFGGITKFDKDHTYVIFADKDAQSIAYNEYVKTYKNIVTYPDSGIQELLDTHIRSLARKLLYEEFDKNNIDAVETKVLLAEISEGGRKGRAALYRLEDAMADVMEDVTTCYYNSFYDGRETAWEGFRKVTREFVFDIERMPYENYTKYLYEQLHTFFEEEVIERNFLIDANAGKNMNPVDAMRELAYLYTDAPKNSYEKALAYEAGVEWLKIYQNNAMSQIEKQTSFLEIIPSLIECEKIPEYDVVYIELEEKIRIAVEFSDFISPETAKALCWGINQIYDRKKRSPFFMISKVVVNDDNTIDTSERGIYFSQNEAEEAILDWSTNNRMHLLCYIMRIVPRRKQFSDDFVKVAEGEPLSDDMICREFVYQPTGFQRKFNFNIGDEVRYICFDGRALTLQYSRITQLPTIERNFISLSDGNLVPSRYVFPINA